MFDQPIVHRDLPKPRTVIVAERAVEGARVAAHAGTRLPYLFGFVFCGFFTVLWGFAALASIFFSPPAGIGAGLFALGAGWAAKRNWKKLHA